ncbi:MAG: hypothetical protein JWP30_1192, partial [Homoserinimonas sp.]|nr:hypothetical protein [Homoserinimonas sp.]
MSISDLVEDTLGVTVGRRNKDTAATSANARALRQARAMGASLGTGYLGVGSGVMAAIQVLYGLSLLVWNWETYPSTLMVSLAWLLLVACLGAVAVAVATRGDNMPTWMFGGIVLVLVFVVSLDFMAVWPLRNIGAYASASACAGVGLLVSVTMRPAREILLAAGALGIAFVVAIAVNTPLTPLTLPAQLGTLALAVAPPVIGVYVVRRFRHLVQTELDRVLVQSTVSAPRFAVGMLASEELARLDLAAEELLDSVATGRTQLPLTPKMASTAASLATELRLHLIEGRRETWLYHAVTESEKLGKSVSLRDRGSLAGLLDPRQRDGLFAAVWLLVTDRDKKPASLELTIGPALPAAADTPAGKICVPIVLATKGISRSRVDSSTWDALGKVGHYVASTQDSSLRVEIECYV